MVFVHYVAMWKDLLKQNPARSRDFQTWLRSKKHATPGKSKKMQAKMRKTCAIPEFAFFSFFLNPFFFGFFAFSSGFLNFFNFGIRAGLPKMQKCTISEFAFLFAFFSIAFFFMFLCIFCLFFALVFCGCIFLHVFPFFQVLDFLQ